MKTFFTKQNRTCPNREARRGFTLVETLVAISIFTFSLLTLMVVLSRGISDADYSKAKDTSAYLAQEGVEDIRNMRDTYMLYDTTAAQGWADFKQKLTNGGCFGGNGCNLNADSLFSLPQPMPITQISLTSCGASCTNLTYDPGTGTYGYAGSVTTGYTRKIMASIISPDQTRISSTVNWVEGTNTYSLTFSDDLYNWIQ